MERTVPVTFAGLRLVKSSLTFFPVWANPSTRSLGSDAAGGVLQASISTFGASLSAASAKVL